MATCPVCGVGNLKPVSAGIRPMFECSNPDCPVHRGGMTKEDIVHTVYPDRKWSSSGAPCRECESRGRAIRITAGTNYEKDGHLIPVYKCMNPECSLYKKMLHFTTGKPVEEEVVRAIEGGRATIVPMRSPGRLPPTEKEVSAARREAHKRKVDVGIKEGRRAKQEFQEKYGSMGRTVISPPEAPTTWTEKEERELEESERKKMEAYKKFAEGAGEHYEAEKRRMEAEGEADRKRLEDEEKLLRYRERMEREKLRRQENLRKLEMQADERLAREREEAERRRMEDVRKRQRRHAAAGVVQIGPKPTRMTPLAGIQQPGPLVSEERAGAMYFRQLIGEASHVNQTVMEHIRDQTQFMHEQGGLDRGAEKEKVGKLRRWIDNTERSIRGYRPRSGQERKLMGQAVNTLRITRDSLDRFVISMNLERGAEKARERSEKEMAEFTRRKIARRTEARGQWKEAQRAYLERGNAAEASRLLQEAGFTRGQSEELMRRWWKRGRTPEFREGFGEKGARQIREADERGISNNSRSIEKVVDDITAYEDAISRFISAYSASISSGKEKDFAKVRKLVRDHTSNLRSLSDRLNACKPYTDDDRLVISIGRDSIGNIQRSLREFRINVVEARSAEKHRISEFAEREAGAAEEWEAAARARDERERAEGLQKFKEMEEAERLRKEREAEMYRRAIPMLDGIINDIEGLNKYEEQISDQIKRFKGNPRRRGVIEAEINHYDRRLVGVQDRFRELMRMIAA